MLESAEPRDVHHFATLFGLWRSSGESISGAGDHCVSYRGGLLDKDFHAAVDDYDNAILHGIVKIASKNGDLHGAVLSVGANI